MSEYVLERELETVAVSRRGGALKIELNRPDVMNAMDGTLCRELLSALRDASADDDVRAVMLTGRGRAFTSGADLAAFSGAGEPSLTTPEGLPDLRRTLRERYNPIVEEVLAMDKPVLSAVNGACVGVGLGVALAGDVIVAAESAYFLLAFINVGLVPDGGASLSVAARIGLTRATEMALLGEKVPATTAFDWGLVNRVHADAVFMSEAETMLDRLAEGPTRAYAGTKRLLRTAALSGMTAQLELEADAQQEMAGTKDFVEGVVAFSQKRASAFTGR